MTRLAEPCKAPDRETCQRTHWSLAWFDNRDGTSGVDGHFDNPDEARKELGGLYDAVVPPKDVSRMKDGTYARRLSDGSWERVWPPSAAV